MKFDKCGHEAIGGANGVCVKCLTLPEFQEDVYLAGLVEAEGLNEARRAKRIASRNRERVKNGVEMGLFMIGSKDGRSLWKKAGIPSIRWTYFERGTVYLSRGKANQALKMMSEEGVVMRKKADEGLTLEHYHAEKRVK